LGGTGGGRDNWKREAMGKIADQYCSQIVLTNEDPYDEDPNKIVEDVKKGITNKPFNVLMDRRQAIRYALNQAKKDDVVIITGKGTDPYIMGPNGSKTPWSDAEVVRQELNK
jgi:UDP-N-acetylmuramoyl-L-alanyl-D-glutamate--2,6-diaminopimelate ligase